MDYRTLALLATKAADNQDLNEIYNALESLRSAKAYQLREKISKQCEKTALAAKERDFLDSAVSNWTE